MATESENPGNVPIDGKTKQECAQERIENEQLYFVFMKAYGTDPVVELSTGILDSRSWDNEQLEALKALTGAMVLPLFEWEDEAVETACTLRIGVGDGGRSTTWNIERKCSVDGEFERL